MMTVRDFLGLLFGAVTEGALELTYLAPEGITVYPHLVVDWQAMPLAIPDSYGRTLTQRNGTGYGVYFGVTVRREAKPPVIRTGKKGDYTAYVRGHVTDAHILTTFWADVDDSSPEAYARLLALSPSLIVSSGGGYHGYWLLDTPHTIHEVDMQEIKWALKGIAKKCDGDAKVAELARIMRLPNTANTKPSRKGAVAQVVYVNSVRYTYADLIGTYAKHGKPPEPPVTRTLYGRISPLPKWVEDYLASGASSGSRNHTLFTMACSCKGVGMSEGEAESLLLHRALADGLDEREAQTTIKSAYRRNVTVIFPPEDKWRQNVIAGDDHILSKRKKRGEA